MNNRMIVIGAGPIGGIIGGRLARAGHDITFVDIDKEHVAAIREKGLQVDVPDGSFNVRVNIVYPSEIQGKFDIGFIAVRSNYTPDALHTAMPHLAENGLLVSMQNGINPPLLQDRVGPDRTVGMAIRMGSRKVAPGHLHTTTR
ncbi:MAG: ketopantoate reductase family protein, partial [Deltaproteobacteria bacterium]